MVQEAEALGLSEATLAALNELIAEVRAEDEELRKQNETAAAELRTLLNESLPSMEAMAELSDRIGDAVKRGRELTLRCSHEARSLLTPEQRREFMELRRKTRVKRRNAGQPRR